MGLAKFLEDNLERLYESLEESKRQVNAIDEESSNKDLGFIKSKISKELELVQAEYERVLKIVTDPDFDEIVELYEEKLKLEKRLKNKQKVIDLLREAVAKYRSEFESIHGTTTNVLETLQDRDKKIENLNKIIEKLEYRIEETKSEMITAKNGRSHYENVFHNQLLINQQLTTEVADKDERILSLTSMLEPNFELFNILENKDDKIYHIKNELMMLDEWCEMLELELGMEGKRPVEIATDQRIGKNKKRKPVTLSIYHNLAYEKTELENKLIKKSKSFVDINDEISRLKDVIKRGQTHISILEQSNEHLISELKLVNEDKTNSQSKVEPITKEQFVRIPRDKVASNTYGRIATANTISEHTLRTKSKPRTIRTRRTDNTVQNLKVKEDSTTQYLDYLEKVTRK
jgi:tetratricopeptide (TPR) repeat protein